MRVLGASVRGPAHVADGRPNEDAWFSIVNPSGALAVVCDGVGSRAKAREGARAAVRAVRAAWRLWSRAPDAAPDDLIRLLEVTWRLGLGPVRPEEACTTCLLAGIRPDGGVLLAQLGDGLLGWLPSDGPLEVVAPERSVFASVTLGLGMPHALRDWRIRALPSFPPGSAVLLATDGIADDLVPDRRAEFIRWIRSDLASLPDARTQLRRALGQWPVPHHLDDKTLVILWNPATT